MSTMDPATKAERIAVLQEEMQFIHHANQHYWRQATPSHAAKAHYYSRQERLEKIRRELSELQERNWAAYRGSDRDGGV
jgi:hypothetical protein